MSGAEDRVLLALPRQGGTSEVRLMRRTHRGVERIDLRRWFRADDGSMCPTRQGVTLRPDELAGVIAALAELERGSDAA